MPQFVGSAVVIDGITKRMFCFGDNSHHQCSPQNVETVHIPTEYGYLNKIDRTVNIRKAECGKHFTCCLTEKGYFFGFGRAKFIMNSTDHKDAIVPWWWFNTNRGLFRDISCGLDHVVLVQKFGGNIVTMGYRWDKFDGHCRVIALTDCMYLVDRSNFDQFEDHSTIDRIIGGVEDCILIFRNET